MNTTGDALMSDVQQCCETLRLHTPMVPAVGRGTYCFVKVLPFRKAPDAESSSSSVDLISLKIQIEPINPLDEEHADEQEIRAAFSAADALSHDASPEVKKSLKEMENRLSAPRCSRKQFAGLKIEVRQELHGEVTLVGEGTIDESGTVTIEDLAFNDAAVFRFGTQRLLPAEPLKNPPAADADAQYFVIAESLSAQGDQIKDYKAQLGPIDLECSDDGKTLKFRFAVEDDADNYAAIRLTIDQKSGEPRTLIIVLEPPFKQGAWKAAYQMSNSEFGRLQAELVTPQNLTATDRQKLESQLKGTLADETRTRVEQLLRTTTEE